MRVSLNLSGNSSVGRAQPCQGWGREFESRFPLQDFYYMDLIFLGLMQGYDKGARRGKKFLKKRNVQMVPEHFSETF